MKRKLVIFYSWVWLLCINMEYYTTIVLPGEEFRYIELTENLSINTPIMEELKMIKHKELYNAITTFANKYGSRKFNDDENMKEYNKLVDLCIKCSVIPECNRKEYSTHNELTAAIAYESNRIAICQ